MRNWFLSFNSRDEPLMQGLQQTLARKDPKARIFFSPTSLRAGGLWLPELAKGIAEATCFVLLVGAKGVGPWQVMEYYEAFDRRVKEPEFPVVVLLLEDQPAPGLPFLRQLHWVVTDDPASDGSVATLLDAVGGAGTAPKELWRHTAPYRGLEAMTASDADYFFGRTREASEIIGALAAEPGRLPVLLGNSGVGKSSLAQAGAIAAFMRQANPDPAAAWPTAFEGSRRWCFLTLKPGAEPVRALVERFLWTWQFEAADPRRAERLTGWVDSLMAKRARVSDLLDATQERYRGELHQTEPPAFFLYVDQGEELYTRAEQREQRRFSEIVAEALQDARLHGVMSLRADFFGNLQRDEPLWGAHRQINVPPLREAQLRDVVSRPAALLGARFEPPEMAEAIARRTADESTRDAGALPLLSYLLDDMWKKMSQRGDGVLRLPAQAIELGGVLVERADAFLALHPAFEDDLRRIFTLKLANVREGEEPTRRRAARAEFTDAEWRLVSDLADHPNRLLVTATSETGETWAEVAHEAIFRRWGKLRGWIAAETEFLSWKTWLEAARRSWLSAPFEAKEEALLMGAALSKARSWLGRRAADLSQADRDFIESSAAREDGARRRALRTQASIYVLLVGAIIGLVGWIEQATIAQTIRWWTDVRPFMLSEIRPFVRSSEADRAARPGEVFRECRNASECPDMIVVPPGRFSMGSLDDEPDSSAQETPVHDVTIVSAFAVSKYPVTFEQWDTCVAHGDCDHASASTWGRGRRPVINVTWDLAQRYVAWLSRATGRQYRLLSEAEYEYAARAGTRTAYPWGDDIGTNRANCKKCGSQWDDTMTAPVGQFAPNGLGLYDMIGNVYTWIEDCHHRNYEGAPTDGSAWTAGGNCDVRVFRGGSWDAPAAHLRTSFRSIGPKDVRDLYLGFRVARTLND